MYLVVAYNSDNEAIAERRFPDNAWDEITHWMDYFYLQDVHFEVTKEV